MEKETFWMKIRYSLRRIGGMFSSTALDWIRSGPALFFTFIYPIAMILLFGYIFGAAPDDSMYTLYYLNEDTYQIGDEIFTYNPAQQVLENLGLNNQTLSEELNLRLIDANFSTAQISPENWARDKSIPYILVIPAGWSAAVNESKIDPTAPKANVEFYYDPSYISYFEIQSIIDSVLQELNLLEFGIPTLIEIETTTTPERESLDYIDFYVPGIIMVTISTSGMMGLVATTTSQTITGFIFKLASTPIKKWEWATSHLLWQAVMGIIVAILTVLTGWIAFGFNMATIHPLMIPILIFGSMTFGGLGLIIARFVKRPEAAMAATMTFVFPQMFLAGAIFPPESLPNYMQIIAKIFPLYYISESMRSVMLESTFNNVWVPFGVTIAMGIVFFVVGSIITVWRKE